MAAGDRVRTFRYGRWRAVARGPDAARWLETLIERIDRCGAPAGAQRVRSLPGRVVWRCETPAALYAKHCVPDTLADRVRFTLWRSRVEQEWRNLCVVQERGLPVVEPLGWAQRRRAGLHLEAVLLTRACPGRPLGEILRDAGELQRRRLLEAWAELLARAHEAGIWLRDVHPGNVLVLSGGAPALVLVDVQKARCRRGPLGRRERLVDLGMLLWTAGVDAAKGERDLVWTRYRQACCLPEADSALWLRALEAQCARWASRWVCRRLQRRLSDRTAYVEERLRGGGRLVRRSDMSREELERVIERHGEILRRGRGTPGWIKRDAASSVTRVASGAGHVAVKEFGARSPLRALGYLVRPHRALAAWRNAHAVALRGWSTPLPVALLESRRWGLPARSYLVTRWEEGSEELPAFIDRRFAANLRERPRGRARGTWEAGGERRPMSARREAVAVRALATFFAALHAANFYHGDLKPPNLLVREDEGRDDESAFEFLLVDLEAVRLRASLTWGRRVKNLAQLADWVTAFEPQVKRTHLARFLRRYLALQPWLLPYKRELVRAVGREVERKRARRARLRETRR